jgi:hypothetical protein
MSQKSPRNIAASVHQRIINLARAQNSDANLIFTRYGLERFLYRLSRSRHSRSPTSGRWADPGAHQHELTAFNSAPF